MNQIEKIITDNHEQENILVATFGKQKRWVNWKYETVGGKETKIPYQTNGIKASSTNPSNWSTYENAIKTSQNIGIVFTLDQLLLGIDLDHCLKGNVIVHEEKEKIERFISEANTYTEISPSGNGLHAFLLLTAPLSLIANRNKNFEVYTSGRYFTATNNPYGKVQAVRTVTPDEAIRLLSIIGYPWGKKKTQRNIIVPVAMPFSDDMMVLKKMFASKNGSKIKALYDGNTAEYNNDDSSADMALCSHLAYWTECNEKQIEYLWLSSPLGRREKTQNRKDYRERTIAVALQSQQEKKKDSSLKISKNENFKINFSKDSKKTSHEIAKHLVEKYYVKTIGERVRDVYIYKDGMYILGLNFLKAEIQEILEEFANVHYKTNIIEMIKDFTSASRNDFGVDENLINLNNGVFDIKNKKLISHSPEYLFFTKIPINYNASATCPTIENFLNDILPNEDKKIILEWFGYCLYRNYFIKKAIIFVGERDTGKSTLIKLFEKFIGKENTSGVSLQKIASDKFASSHLYNKHINVYDDLSFKDINDNGTFKMATGDGVMSGEKKFGDQFQFHNFSKLTFACNKIPDVKDATDDAYFNRWIIIPFLAEIKEIDKFLTQKITTQDELSGLLNLAILGLSEILKKQGFSYSKSPEEIKKEMLLSGSMIANFANDCLEEKTGAWVSKDEMYEECARYAQSNHLPTVSKQSLGRKLSNHSGYIIDGTKLVNKSQEQGWRNVKIKGKEESGQDG